MSLREALKQKAVTLMERVNIQEEAWKEHLLLIEDAGEVFKQRLEQKRQEKPGWCHLDDWEMMIDELLSDLEAKKMSKKEEGELKKRLQRLQEMTGTDAEGLWLLSGLDEAKEEFEQLQPLTVSNDDASMIRQLTNIQAVILKWFGGGEAEKKWGYGEMSEKQSALSPEAKTRLELSLSDEYMYSKWVPFKGEYIKGLKKKVAELQAELEQAKNDYADLSNSSTELFKSEQRYQSKARKLEETLGEVGEILTETRKLFEKVIKRRGRRVMHFDQGLVQGVIFALGELKKLDRKTRECSYHNCYLTPEGIHKQFSCEGYKERRA